MDPTTVQAVDYTSQLNSIQVSLDTLNANIQYQNCLIYIFVVCFFTILVCCLLYKVLKIFI